MLIDRKCFYRHVYNCLPHPTDKTACINASILNVFDCHLLFGSGQTVKGFEVKTVFFPLVRGSSGASHCVEAPEIKWPQR